MEPTKQLRELKKHTGRVPYSAADYAERKRVLLEAFGEDMRHEDRIEWVADSRHKARVRLAFHRRRNPEMTENDIQYELVEKLEHEIQFYGEVLGELQRADKAAFNKQELSERPTVEHSDARSPLNGAIAPEAEDHFPNTDRATTKEASGDRSACKEVGLTSPQLDGGVTSGGTPGPPPVDGSAGQRLPRPGKGDLALLGENQTVSFRKAEEYLGIGERHRQILVKSGSLRVTGKGQNRRITRESLTEYLPPEKPK